MTAVTPELRILHAIRVAGWVSADRLGAWLPATERTATIDDESLLGNDSFFTATRTPRGEVYGLTALGRTEASDRLAGLLDSTRVATKPLLGEFESFDRRLKVLVTAFQRDRSEANARALVDFHGEVDELLERIADSTPLWTAYPGRFRAAVDEIARQNWDFVASPLLDSYHTVWHFLHRDMRLVTEEAN